MSWPGHKYNQKQTVIRNRKKEILLIQKQKEKTSEGGNGTGEKKGLYLAAVVEPAQLWVCHFLFRAELGDYYTERRGTNQMSQRYFLILWPLTELGWRDSL